MSEPLDPLSHLRAVEAYHLEELERVRDLIKGHETSGLYHKQERQRRKRLQSLWRVFLWALLVFAPIFRDVVKGALVALGWL